jgi:hypothetical protein
MLIANPVSTLTDKGQNGSHIVRRSAAIAEERSSMEEEGLNESSMETFHPRIPSMMPC